MVYLIIFVLWKTWVGPIRLAKVAATQLSTKDMQQPLGGWGCSCCVGKYQSTLILRNTPMPSYYTISDFWPLDTTLPSIGKNSSQDVFGQFSRQLHCKGLVVCDFGSATWNRQICLNPKANFVDWGICSHSSTAWIKRMKRDTVVSKCFKKADIPIPIIH